MWQRLLASTILGEAVDTTIFCMVAFYGLITNAQMANYILVGIVFKITVETIMLPITYRVIRWLKRQENTDHFDKTTNFTPLSVQLDD
ncbi:MAG: VUT family protein, partial [Candidatus Saccharimonadales bacterium]